MLPDQNFPEARSLPDLTPAPVFAAPARGTAVARPTPPRALIVITRRQPFRTGDPQKPAVLNTHGGLQREIKIVTLPPKEAS